MWETLKEHDDYEINTNYPYVIRRKDTKQIISERVSGDKRYIKCNLRDNTIRKTCLKHRLVAKQWIPNPNNLPQVDHIDNNKSNNHISNLRWTSCSENTTNKSKANGRSYVFLSSLPENTATLTNYESYEFDDLFVNYTTQILYRKIGPRYRECVKYKSPKGNELYAVKSKDGKKTSISYNKLFKR